MSRKIEKVILFKGVKMEEKNKKINQPKKIKVVKKKRKKPTQQQIIKLVAIGLMLVFVGSIIGGSLASVFMKNPTGSNYTEVDVQNQLVQSAKEYEEKIAENPKDTESLYNLVEIYSQLGYFERNKKNEENAVNNFMKAVEYATLLKEASPTMATSADYLRAGYLGEAGKLDEAKVIYETVIEGNTDPLISRIVYADFLKNKMKDDAAAAIQVQAAKDAAATQAETEYVESLLKQYNLI
jgi:tetratricopeptide (TPR) repeat protein